MIELDQNITGRQIAAARALVGMNQPRLAQDANISVPTLKRMEASEGVASGLANNVLAVRRALEAAGVEFTNGGQPGVRMKMQPYTIADLANVVRRFKANIVSTPGWEDLEILPLNNGFEISKNGQVWGRVTVIKEEAIFEPSLPVPTERTDGWVTEAELRFWLQSLSYPRGQT